MEWAIFEGEHGNYDKARELFSRGADLDPPHTPLLAAWAHFEAGHGQYEEAKRIQAKADACIWESKAVKQGNAEVAQW